MCRCFVLVNNHFEPVLSSINVVSFVSSESQEITHGTMQEQNIFHCVCWKNNSWNTPIIPYYKINTPIQWSQCGNSPRKTIWFRWMGGVKYVLDGDGISIVHDISRWIPRSGRTSCARFGSWDARCRGNKKDMTPWRIRMYAIYDLPSVYPSHVSIYIIDGSYGNSTWWYSAESSMEYVIRDSW